MPHVRTQLRKALDPHLKAKVSVVEGRVFSRYQDPFFAPTLETMDGLALMLAVMSADVDDGGSSSGGASLQYRDLNVEVTVVGFASTTIDDDLEDALVEVEVAMAAFAELPIKLLSMVPGPDEFVEFGSSDRGDLVGLKQRFTARVATRGGRPDVSLLKG